MTAWKTTGIIATIIIVLSIPLYILKTAYLGRPQMPAAMLSEPTFVGSDRCRDCHRNAYDQWRGSHHQQAMAAATAETVLGDFNDAVFEHRGVASRFFQKDGRFFVDTRGTRGERAQFAVTHTFGVHPLQQYLVPFPGGRLQCLPYAWNVERRQWYLLYEHAVDDPDDWLYWTNAGQNWNGMCAECHSTNLQKNVDLETGDYQTTWSEISVGCEACHGPGSRHVTWAEMPDMARPRVENADLVVRTRGLSPRQQIALCAPCHSRRMSLGDNPHRNIDFMDYGIPQLLGEGLYFPDGQILEEVYVYGSFIQSKMYDRGVRCSDCHNVHSTRRIKEKNALCLQCHRAAVYDTRDHHFHKKAGEAGDPIRAKDGNILFEVGTGALCEQCHMPGRFYMGIDYRPDHSFRIPRPDLSQSIGVPNACSRCHVDKTIDWAAETMKKWYGTRQWVHYGSVLEAGRRNDPAAADKLVRLVEDRLYPAIVRATALSLLDAYPGPDSARAFERALTDEEPILRYNALRQLREPDLGKRVAMAVPLLYDPVRAVRTEAANLLASVPVEAIPPKQRQRYAVVLDEYRKTMAYTADFAASRHNLGNLYANTGALEQAVENYRKAIEIDHKFYPAKVNLAMLYNRMNNNAEAERLLREVVVDYPDLHEVKYSLGLLLAEEKKYAESVAFLRLAADGMPGRARVHYNLGQLLAYLNRDQDAESALSRALSLGPEDPEILQALASFHLQRGQWDQAKRFSEMLLAAHPTHPEAQKMLDYIKRTSGK